MALLRRVQGAFQKAIHLLKEKTRLVELDQMPRLGRKDHRVSGDRRHLGPENRSSAFALSPAAVTEAVAPSKSTGPLIAATL